MARSFGMNESVISLICVAAWKIETRRPTASAVSSRGAETTTVTNSACWTSVRTAWEPMTLSETRYQRAHEQRPAVDEHEQHQLEGQRDQHRREHHHPHRHQHARHDDVDDQERQEHHEADLERGLQLAGDERRDEHAQRD